MALKKVADPYTGVASDSDQPFLGDSSANKDENADARTTRNNDSANNDSVVVPSAQSSLRNSNPKKGPTDVEDEPLTVLMTVPPDGGWGWVVVAASFIANFIVDGILYCYGVFIPVIREDFNEGEAKVSIPGSLLAGFYLMTGPFVTVLTNKYGFQKVVVGGAIFAAASFALSSIAMNVDFLIFSYGLLGGIGFGMIYSPSIVTVGYYFERWRGIATGIAVCGSGIGTFTLAPLNEIFIDSVGWKNTLLIQAGIILICGLCGMTFRPIKPVKVAINENLDEEEGKAEELLKSRQSLPEENKRSGSIISLKSKPPTAAEILQITGRPPSSDTTTTKLSKSSQSLNVSNAIIGYNEDVEKNEKRLSVPNIEEDDLGPIGVQRQKKQRSMSQVADHPKGVDERRKRTTSEISSSLSLGQSVECIIRSRRGTITQVGEKVKVPLSRDDAHFTGSLTRLPQYQLEKETLSYTLSVTRIPQKKEPSRMSPSAIWKSISDLFDFSLLLSPSFDLFLLSGLLTMLGYFTPFNYLKDRAQKEGGWTTDECVWLLSTIGITNTVGRVLSGLVAGLPKMDATFMNNIALLIAGIATMVSGISFSIPYQYGYCAVFGFSTATFACLRSVMVVDLLGLENLNNAFGLLLFVQGLGSALGSPLSGLVYQATKNYDASFYFSGILIIISGLILFPLKAINRWEKRKRNKSASQMAKPPNCT